MTDAIANRWTHPEVILVATSLSDLDQLIPLAFAQARETGARLILFHAIAPSATLNADATGMPYYDAWGAVDAAEHMLSPWSQRAQDLGIQCNSLVREGVPVEQICAVVRQFHADRMILGTRSRSRLSKMLLGSVAEQVLRSVNIPVLTVGPEAHLQVDSGAPRVVLYATTLRETSRPSAALAYSIAASQNAQLVLLHVVPPAEETSHKGLPIGLDSVAMRELRVLATKIGAIGSTQIEPVVLHGNPAIEILAEASVRCANLIVLGAAHRTPFERIARDRTVYRVLAHAACPVLTLREAGEQIAQPTPEETAVLHQ
jgi:nucleotide-binding universal stress UspA family protein